MDIYIHILISVSGHLPDKSCIIIGDTPDDIRAGVAAGIRAYGVLTPDEEAKLTLKIVKSSQVLISLLRFKCVFLFHIIAYEDYGL
jgi:phosphoglycolate phosphatase-like HAD superfamily hydrolase